MNLWMTVVFRSRARARARARTRQLLVRGRGGRGGLMCDRLALEHRPKPRTAQDGLCNATRKVDEMANVDGSSWLPREVGRDCARIPSDHEPSARQAWRECLDTCRNARLHRLRRSHDCGRGILRTGVHATMLIVRFVRRRGRGPEWEQ